MKSIVIYFSSYRGQTEKLATWLGHILDGDTVSLKDAENTSLDKYDLIAIGSGIYHESMPQKVLDFANSIDVMGKKAIVFSTSGAGTTTYNKPLTKILSEKGAELVGSYACKGSFTSSDFTDKKVFELFEKKASGHPNMEDLKKIEKKLLETL